MIAVSTFDTVGSLVIMFTTVAALLVVKPWKEDRS